MNRFWERVMLVLVVCVPVPALALSGLSVPLPSVVERVAAALVPFGDATVLDGGSTLAAGRIVLTADTKAVEAPVGTQAGGDGGARDRAGERRCSSHSRRGDSRRRYGEHGASNLDGRRWRDARGAHGRAGPAPAEPEPATPEEPAAPEEPADRDPAPAPAPTPAPTPAPRPAPSPGDNRKKLDRTPEKEPTKDIEPVPDVVDTTPVPDPVGRSTRPRRSILRARRRSVRNR